LKRGRFDLLIDAGISGKRAAERLAVHGRGLLKELAAAGAGRCHRKSSLRIISGICG
jgi:hypothetical protein